MSSESKGVGEKKLAVKEKLDCSRCREKKTRIADGVKEIEGLNREENI